MSDKLKINIGTQYIAANRLKETINRVVIDYAVEMSEPIGSISQDRNRRNLRFLCGALGVPVGGKDLEDRKR